MTGAAYKPEHHAHEPTPTLRPCAPPTPTASPVLSVLTAYTLLMGPAVVQSGAIVLYILGVLSPGSTNAALGFAPHLQAACTAMALMAALGIARLDTRRGLPIARSRLGPTTAGTLLRAAEILGYPSGLAALWWARDLNGYAPAGMAAMAVAGATLCPLLARRFGGCQTLLAPRADRSGLSDSRRSLVLSMSGMLLVPLAGHVLTGDFIRFAPLADVYRFAQTQGGSPVNMASGLVVNVPLMALNAVTEEMVCAMLLVLAMRYARRPVWQIIAMAALLRIGYHLQEGPYGLAAGIFGAANVWVLIRYRRILPLMVAHFAYDTAVLVGVGLFAGHSTLIGYAPVLLCPPAIAALLLADLAVRRRPGPGAEIVMAERAESAPASLSAE